MSELFREIEDDIRQERIDKLWHSFGKIMIVVSIAVIVVTIIVVAIENHQQSEAMDMTSLMIKGTDKFINDDFKGAIGVFDDVIKKTGTSLSASDNASPPYYGLAMLRKAQAEIALGEKDEAKKTYETLAGRDNVFGALAKMLSYGNSAAGEVIAQPDKKSPFYYSQSEFRGWQLLQQGKKTEAVDIFSTLANDLQSPASLRERAGEVVRQLNPDKLTATRDDKKSVEATHE